MFTLQSAVVAVRAISRDQLATITKNNDVTNHCCANYVKQGTFWLE